MLRAGQVGSRTRSLVKRDVMECSAMTCNVVHFFHVPAGSLHHPHTRPVSSPWVKSKCSELQ